MGLPLSEIQRIDAAGVQPRELLQRLAAGNSLSFDETRATFGSLLSGNWRDLEVGALLTALRVRGETAAEIAGAAAALRGKVEQIDPPIRGLLDTCGTGGDRSGTFNISTASAIVVAACGVHVAKHGNRSVSSSSGSADVLSELGLNIAAEPAVVVECLRRHGLAFFFAPSWHGAMKAVAPIRAGLGFRTIFNLIGPLSNPVGADHQLVGVGRFATSADADHALARAVANALMQLGTVSSIVVSGHDGLDEVSLAAPTLALRINKGAIVEEIWQAEDFELPTTPLELVRVESPAASAAAILTIFQGQNGPHRNYVVANSSAALLAAGRVRSLAEGAEMAARAIDEGAALAKLNAIVNFETKR